MNSMKRYYGLQDARSTRGIYSRGNARYPGIAKAPKPGNIFNIRRAAQKRLTNNRRRVNR